VDPCVLVTSSKCQLEHRVEVKGYSLQSAVGNPSRELPDLLGSRRQVGCVISSVKVMAEHQRSDILQTDTHAAVAAMMGCEGV
jgi:hypothetical protein